MTDYEDITQATIKIQKTDDGMLRYEVECGCVTVSARYSTVEQAINEGAMALKDELTMEVKHS